VRALGKSELPISMTGHPGWNMRESGLGVDCVCMNILRRCPASHFIHSEFCFSQHLHIQKFKAQEKKLGLEQSQHDTICRAQFVTIQILSQHLRKSRVSCNM
jgi:hypothetical protein